MKILLTGASGFLGSHTAAELVRRGHSVTAMVRATSRRDILKDLGLDLLDSSLPDCHGLENLLEKADVVVHVAGIVKSISSREFFRINEIGTAGLVEKILRSSKKPKLFLHISTIAVHNPQNGPDFCLPPEDCRPLTYYGASKLAGERALSPLKGKVRTVILRPPVLYGPRDLEFLPIFRAVTKGYALLYRGGKNKLSLCFVRDAARGIGEIVDETFEEDKIYCLDDGEIHNWESIAKEISRTVDLPTRMIPIPRPLFYAAAALSQGWARLRGKPAILTLNKLKEIQQETWVCGHQKISEDLGWKARVSLREGFQLTLDYYRQAGCLKS